MTTTKTKPFTLADIDPRIVVVRDPVVDRTLAKRAAEQIRAHPESHDQDDWHSECGTIHCAAGWIVRLAGNRGRDLENRFGPGPAAAMLLGVPRIDCEFGGDDDPLPWLDRLGAS